MSHAVGGFVLRVRLPQGWAERMNMPPGHVYGAGDPSRPGGQLRVTVDEPVEILPGETLDERLWTVLEEIAYADSGERIHKSAGDSALGRIVTAAFHHPRFGLVQIWVSGGPKGTVMGTYTMYLEDTVAHELVQSQGIMESADLAELDPTSPHSA